MNIGSGEARRIETVEDNIRTLTEDAEKMGLTPEIRDLLEEFDEYKNRLEKKVRELSIIEAIAMESMDENIIDLREQLFMTVKLIHSDEIEEVTKEYGNREQERGSVIHLDSDVKEDTKIRKYDVIERMRRYLNKRAEYKKIKEFTRKSQPTVPHIIGNL